MICLFCTIQAADSQEYVVFRLILNGEDKGEFFCLLSPDRDVLMKRDDLARTGLKEGIGSDIRVDQESFVSLSSISDLDFTINERDVALEITVSPDLLREQSIEGTYRKSPRNAYRGTASGFLNYAGTYIDESAGAYLDVSGELGISLGDYFGRSTFAYQRTDDNDKALRLETSLTISDGENLRTATIGDFPALSGIVGSGTLLGGVNVSKNFSLDPYMLKGPSLDLTGTLDTPSDVEVYLDGVLVQRESLSPGHFVFHNVPATVGLGTAEVIINDAYGRERRIASPYYYTENLLKKGLHEYSYSLGFIRKDYGEKSFSYGKAAFLGFHNYGFANDLTLGYAAELSDNVINIGPAASFALSNAGTIDFAMGMSKSGGNCGLSGFLGYAFQSKHVNARMSLRSDSREYSHLGLGPSDDKAKLQLNAAIGFGLKSAGSLTVAYAMSDMYLAENASQTLLAYSNTLTKASTLFVSVSETRESERSYELRAGIHIYFGRTVSGNVSYTGREDADDKRVSVQKSLPPGTGYGFRADLENTRDDNNAWGSLQYQHDYGIYEVGYREHRDNRRRWASVSGGVGYIDRSIFFSRPILDSFAKVKVGELEGVRTYFYGNEVGRTNRNGEVIVPNMHSFYENKIDIDIKDIPLNYSVSSLTQYLSPPFRSGSLVAFDVRKIQSIGGRIYLLHDGREIPVESAVMQIETAGGTVQGLVGTEGEFYVENVPPGEHRAIIIAGEQKLQCTITIPDSDEMLLDTGNTVCEAAQ